MKTSILVCLLVCLVGCSETPKPVSTKQDSASVTQVAKPMSDSDAQSWLKASQYDRQHPLVAVKNQQIAKPLLSEIQLAYSPSEVKMNDQVLRVITGKPVLKIDFYSFNLKSSICGSYWANKDAWGHKDWQRIEFLNSDDGQGFAFVGGKSACDELGKAKVDNNYLAQHTWVCTSGQCRPRQNGEITSGDE